MPISKEPFYFSKTNQNPINICGINFEKSDQDYLTKKAFWLKANCLDFLLNIKYSYRTIEKVKTFRNEFIHNNSDVGKWQNKKKHYQLKSPHNQNSRPLWFQGRNQNKLSVNSEKLNTIIEEFDRQIHKERQKGITLFNEQHPDVSAIIDYAIECMQFIHDLFNSQNFSTVNTNKGIPIKCNSKKFKTEAKEAGFRCVWELNQTANEIENNRQIPDIEEFIYSITPEIENWWNALVKQAKRNCLERDGENKRLLDIPKEKLYEASIEVYKKHFAGTFDCLKLQHIDDMDLYILTDQEKIRKKSSSTLTECYTLYREVNKNKSQQ